MDDRLNHYINSMADAPPFVDERQLVKRLEQRKKRRWVILLSLAASLWTIAVYLMALVIASKDRTLGITLLAAISGGYICAGCFAGIVVKIRRVVF